MEPRRWQEGEQELCSALTQPTGWHPSNACSAPLQAPGNPGPSLPRTPCFHTQLGASWVPKQGGPGALPRKGETDKGVGGK